MESLIPQERIQILRGGSAANRSYILYWMQASQRTFHNDALNYAIEQANFRHKPLVVFFGITDSFPEANLRHYTFMLEGLMDVYHSLAEMNIPFIVQKVSPATGALQMSKDADIVITDRGYLHIQKQWRQSLAKQIDCPLIQVESDVVVPVETAYPKAAYGAYVLRPKMHHFMPFFLNIPDRMSVQHPSISLDIPSLFPNTIQDILRFIDLNLLVKPSSFYQGGQNRAIEVLDDFICNKLEKFHVDRNDPSLNGVSHLSPYLHFGQISPVYITLEAQKSRHPGLESFLEELIVRRELSMNFIHYDPYYDSFSALPDWALKTLSIHADDPREHIYSRQEFEDGNSHDVYWNAAQDEMRITGKMHGYMRMYWGKKILEWSASPEHAFNTALYLNNKYELDGRDPNGFTGVAWCFGKHDRAWPERPVYGKVRSMTSKGLERKFDIKQYVENIQNLKNKGGKV